MLNGPKYKIIDEDRTATMLAHLTFCRGWGLVGGFDTPMAGPTIEALHNDHGIFHVWYLDLWELVNGNYVFDPTSRTGIAWNQFEMVKTQECIVNFNRQPVYNVGLLDRPAILKQILKHVAGDQIATQEKLEETKGQLKKVKKEKKAIERKHIVCLCLVSSVFVIG